MCLNKLLLSAYLTAGMQLKEFPVLWGQAKAFPLEMEQTEHSHTACLHHGHDPNLRKIHQDLRALSGDHGFWPEISHARIFNSLGLSYNGD